jgi:hypothetical protein
MSSNDNYDIYSNENTSPLEEPDPIPPFELESTKADTLEEYDPGGYDQDYDDDDDDEGGNNSRIFMILLGALAGLFIISIVVMVLLSQVILPGRSARQTEQAQLILGENEATLVAATETANAEAVAVELTRIAAEATNTPTVTETVMMPTETSTPEDLPTETPEPAQPTDTPEVEVTPDLTQTEQSLQATVDALATQAAASPTPTEEGAVAPTLNAAQLTATAMASGGSGGTGGTGGDDDELPDTGFMDDGGIYVLSVAAVLLVGVIVGARKLRKAN